MKDLRSETECALDVYGPVCSDSNAIREVAKFVRQKSGDTIKSPFIVISKAKEITNCNTEECVLLKVADESSSAASIIKNTLKNNFKLDGPADSQALLHNGNIDSILDQLVKRHTMIKHIPFHMINFDDHDAPPNIMKTINLLTDVINEKYKSFCVVINTDKYGNSGIHWFCIFCNFKTTGSSTNPFTIEYFNSSGRKPLPSVSNWMIRGKYDIESTGKYVCNIINASTIRHQKDTETECGVYCLYYIYKRINDVDVSYFSTRVKDSEMIEFRKLLFRNRTTNPAD